MAMRYFNPRSPHGERRKIDYIIHTLKTFQSTLPARGATTSLEIPYNYIIISIHAPRTGSDHVEISDLSRGGDISIHAPRTGSDAI